GPSARGGGGGGAMPPSASPASCPTVEQPPLRRSPLRHSARLRLLQLCIDLLVELLEALRQVAGVPGLPLDGERLDQRAIRIAGGSDRRRLRVGVREDL